MVRVLLPVLVLAGLASAETWVTPLEKARERARIAGKPLFIYVYDSV